MQRVQPDKADKILDTLCTRLVTGKKEADRESASISLKTTILDLPGETAKSVLRHVVPKLLQGAQTRVRLYFQLHSVHFVEMCDRKGYLASHRQLHLSARRGHFTLCDLGAFTDN